MYDKLRDTIRLIVAVVFIGGAGLSYFTLAAAASVDSMSGCPPEAPTTCQDMKYSNSQYDCVSDHCYSGSEMCCWE